MLRAFPTKTSEVSLTKLKIAREIVIIQRSLVVMALAGPQREAAKATTTNGYFSPAEQLREI